jgi:hypothetical protein
MVKKIVPCIIKLFVMHRLIFIILLLSQNSFSFAQIKPVTRVNISSKINNIDIANIRSVDVLSSVYSTLHFASYIPNDPDCKNPTCYYWDFISSKQISKGANGINSWKERVMWRKIPQGAMYGRYEISLSPFAVNNTIIKSGIVETKGLDSVYFEINYADEEKPIGVVANKMPPITSKPKLTPPISRPIKENNTIQSNENPALIKINPSIYSTILNNNGRRFYIRIVPLNANKNPLQKISNDITITEYEWKPKPITKPEPTLYDDYTITNIKYIPVNFPNPNYYSCAIVVSYNENMFASYPSIAKSFKDAFPIGTTICPQPPKDKAWYEKAFDGVTGFAAKTIDGASKFYSEAKEFAKSQTVGQICNTLSGEAKKKCNGAADFAVDAALVACGVPPTLPNTDDLTKLAEGQVVDLACDRIESESGVPIPDAARNELKKQIHNKLESESNKGLTNAGFVNVKPHPLGFFQTAYLEIEVTRTSKTVNAKKITGLSISNQCDRPDKFCNNCNEFYGKDKIASYYLFDNTFTEIPFLEEVGEKTKLFVVLKPKESWVHWNKQVGQIDRISYSPPFGEWYTPLPPTYEGASISPGFQLLSNKSIIKFNFGSFKIANGVNTSFTHK